MFTKNSHKYVYHQNTFDIFEYIILSTDESSVNILVESWWSWSANDLAPKIKMMFNKTK